MYSRYPAVLVLFYFYFIFSFEAALENTVLSDKSYKQKYAQTLANFFFFSCVRCLISCVHVFMSAWQFSVYLSIWVFFGLSATFAGQCINMFTTFIQTLLVSSPQNFFSHLVLTASRRTDKGGFHISDILADLVLACHVCCRPVDPC